MPLVGSLVGGVDFTNMYIALSDKITAGLPLEKAKELGAVFAYGQFIQNIIDFLIIALCIFFVIKGLNKIMKKKAEEPAPEPEPSAEEKLLTEIRDLLKEK